MFKLIVFPIISFVLSVGMIPLIIKFCKKHDLYDYVNSRKIHTGKIPRLGGVGIAVSFFIVTLIYTFITPELETSRTVPLIVSGCIIFIFGLLDDLINLNAKIKLVGQIAATTIVVCFDFRFHYVFSWEVPFILSVVVTFFWVLGIINAYNLIDGLDGLCGTLSLSAILTLGISFALFGNSESAICFILAGSILGFLVFNWPPAKIFMGDNGSQFLGFMIAITPLVNSTDVLEYNKWLVMLVLVSFPMIDTIAAIWRRLREHRPIMSPDSAHLHHKLLNLGYGKKQALCLIMVIQVLLCVAIVLSYFLKYTNGTILLFEAYVFMAVFFSVIHYTNRTVVLKKEMEESEKQKSEDKLDQ